MALPFLSMLYLVIYYSSLQIILLYVFLILIKFNITLILVTLIIEVIYMVEDKERRILETFDKNGLCA